MWLIKHDSRRYLPQPRFQLLFEKLTKEENKTIIIELFVSQDHVWPKFKARFLWIYGTFTFNQLNIIIIDISPCRVMMVSVTDSCVRTAQLQTRTKELDIKRVSYWGQVILQVCKILLSQHQLSRHYIIPILSL